MHKSCIFSVSLDFDQIKFQHAKMDAGGFNFDLCKRNEVLEMKGMKGPGFTKTGTTISGIIFKVSLSTPHFFFTAALFPTHYYLTRKRSYLETNNYKLYLIFPSFPSFFRRMALSWVQIPALPRAPPSPIKIVKKSILSLPTSTAAVQALPQILKTSLEWSPPN